MLSQDELIDKIIEAHREMMKEKMDWVCALFNERQEATRSRQEDANETSEAVGGGI